MTSSLRTIRDLRRSALDCRSAPPRVKAPLASLGADAALTRAVAVPVLQLPIDAIF
jgi:hypothetical protein